MLFVRVIIIPVSSHQYPRAATLRFVHPNSVHELAADTASIDRGQAAVVQRRWQLTPSPCEDSLLVPSPILLSRLRRNAQNPPTHRRGQHAILTVLGKRSRRSTPARLTNSSAQWVFKAPGGYPLRRRQASEVGTHSAGPVWTSKDGSSVKGEAVHARTPTPEAGRRSLASIESRRRQKAAASSPESNSFAAQTLTAAQPPRPDATTRNA